MTDDNFLQAILENPRTALFGVSLVGSRLWPWVAGVSALYFTAGTMALGATPGIRIVEAIRLRAPSLFSSRPLHQS